MTPDQLLAALDMGHVHVSFERQQRFAISPLDADPPIIRITVSEDPRKPWLDDASIVDEDGHQRPLTGTEYDVVTNALRRSLQSLPLSEPMGITIHYYTRNDLDRRHAKDILSGQFRYADPEEQTKKRAEAEKRTALVVPKIARNRTAARRKFFVAVDHVDTRARELG